MEKDSGAKISIRGKGSIKEGKGRPEAYAEDAEEDLHCLVIADSDEKVATCVRLINRVIETAASTPEGQNDHKRNQLRELALLNGTLRDDENQVCQNCGGVGHRKYDCPEQKNFTANIICHICGSGGHMARDCTVKRDPNGLPRGGPMGPEGGGPGGNKAFDSEYASLMAELGEGGGGGADGAKTAWGGPSAGGDITAGGSNIPPWRRPEVWQSSQPAQQNQGYRPGYPGGASGYGGQQYPQGGYDQNYGGADSYAQYYQGQYAQQQGAH